MHKRRVAAVAALVLAAFGGGWAMRDPRIPSAAGDVLSGGDWAKDGKAAVTAAMATQSATRIEGASGALRGPLPPANAPLADIYGSLKQRADDGDAHASCRLAFELLRCHDVVAERKQMDAYLRAEEAKLDKLPDFRTFANTMAQRQIDVAKRAAECAAIPVADREAGADYLYRAARAGVVEAQARYVQGQMFGLVADRIIRAEGHAYQHHPEYERWRREAVPMARALLEAGVPEGPYLLADAYMSDETPYAALVPDDAALSFAYVEISRGSVARPPRSDAQFNDADRKRIAEVMRRHPAAQFAGKPHTAASIAPGLELDEEGAGDCQ